MELSPSEFGLLCREFAATLSLVRRRVKKSDDFNADAFEAHLKRRVDSLDQGQRGVAPANQKLHLTAAASREIKVQSSHRPQQQVS